MMITLIKPRVPCSLISRRKLYIEGVETGGMAMQNVS